MKIVFRILTMNRFLRLGKYTPSVDVSLFPRISNVCNLESFLASRPVIFVMSLSEMKFNLWHIKFKSDFQIK